MPDATRRPTLREYVESLLVTVILALFGTTFLLQAFKIPSSSMENTLLVGDHLLVNKFNFASSPGDALALLPYQKVERGDIVVFKYPYPPHQHFVKRVVGVPGDRLRIGSGQVFVNGVAMEEPYAVHDSSLPVRLNETFPAAEDDYPYHYLDRDWAAELPGLTDGDVLVVPPGKYFVLGDNRDNSRDSRYWGLVSRENIIGRPLLIYWSFASSDDARSGDPTVGANSLAALLARARWKRFFLLVH